MLSGFFAAPAFEPGMMAIIFVEGLAAFLSPCILPMLPIYLMYLAGETDAKQKTPLVKILCFILGFTLLFLALGAGATAIGKLLQQNQLWVQRISGIMMIVMGLSYMGLFRLPFLHHGRGASAPKELSPLRAIAFGAALAISWTPCIGPLLGSAMLMAGQTASLWNGLLLLCCFSLGLGVPFLLSGLMYHKISGTLGFLKRHARKIQLVSGALLVIVGLLLTLDLFKYWVGLFV